MHDKVDYDSILSKSKTNLKLPDSLRDTSNNSPGTQNHSPLIKDMPKIKEEALIRKK